MKYDWKDAGEEWSEPWGNSAAQWFGAILPRVRECLPAGIILEIGAGFGRWTHYLRDHCEHLLALDRKEECIDACRRRFAGDSRLSYYVNDGRSLSMLSDDSIDFVFSFDSLVHPARDVLEDYLSELGRKLKIGAKGFVHHSNLGQYANSMRERLPRPIRKLLRKAGILDWEHNRNPTMSASLFREFCPWSGLRCLRQELVNWRGRRLIDCLSLFERNPSNEKATTEIVRNPNFMREAAEIRRRSQRGIDWPKLALNVRA